MDTLIYKMDPPKHVVDRITKAGGVNRYGEPCFRVVWGGNRYHTVGGMFKKVVMAKTDDGTGREIPVVTEVAEVRQLLKYKWDRWHLERWCPPEMYGTREDWYLHSWDDAAQLHTMGDFPDKGDYEHVFYLAMCSHMKPYDTGWCHLCTLSMGEFIPLEENVHILEFQIHALLLSGSVNKDDERRALFLREDQKRQLRNKEVSDRVMEAMRPKMVVENPSTLMDSLGHCKVPDANLGTSLYLPKNKRGFRQSNRAMPLKKQEEIDNA